jgi:hypothetical protein
VFEFEHPDSARLLNRIAALEVTQAGDAVVLREHGMDVIVLDWFNISPFLGDKGNFSKADKTAFVTLHHDAFKQLLTTGTDLFAASVETEETNYLANMSQLKKNYVDSGGVYDVDEPLFAREFLLIVGLQNPFDDVEVGQRRQGRVRSSERSDDVVWIVCRVGGLRCVREVCRKDEVIRKRWSGVGSSRRGRCVRGVRIVTNECSQTYWDLVAFPRSRGLD